METAGGVVDLGQARERRRFVRYQERVGAVLEQNRAALHRLFESGLVYTRHGSRVGQELLRAQQHLLRVSDLVAREAKEEEPRSSAEIDALFDEIESLLEKTSAIARKNRTFFQSC